MRSHLDVVDVVDDVGNADDNDCLASAYFTPLNVDLAKYIIPYRVQLKSL